MLKFLRARKTSFLSWLILGGIIITFVCWGYFRKGMHGQDMAAKVNNEIITVESFNNEYRDLYRNYQSIFKDKFNPELARLYNIKALALNRLIESRVIVQSAKQNGILVTDQDVAIEIQNNPVFKNKSGEFEMDLYQRILRANRFTQNKFESMIRERMYHMKIASLVKMGVRLSPYEITKQYIVENDRITLSYLALEPEKLKASVSPMDISAILKEDSEIISSYYNKHISEYKKPDKVKASHILIKPEDKTEEAVETAKQKITEIAKKVTIKNFKQMAKKYSQGPSAKTGGDLGTFDEKSMDPEFSKTAFSMKPETLSKPVKSRSGWHIIYVEKKIPGFEKSLTSVERKIAKALATQKKQKDMAGKKAREVVEALKNKKNLNKLIAALNLKWEKTPAFKFGSHIPGIGRAEEVIAAAFRLNSPGDLVPRFFLISGNYYFFKLHRREKPDMKNLDTKIADMNSKLSETKERILLNEWQTNLKKSAHILRNPLIMNESPEPGV